jgi:hypothetical protein
MATLKCKECDKWFLNGDIKEVHIASGGLKHKKCPMAMAVTLKVPIASGGVKHAICTTATRGITWTCLTCTYDGNTPDNGRCSMCGEGRHTRPHVVAEETKRWTCNVCTYDNHPLASYCDVCWFDRDTVVPNQGGGSAKASGDAVGSVGSDRDSKHSNPPVMVEDDFTCDICGDVKSNAELYLVSPDCSPLCNLCFARWIETQVHGGNSLELKCPCGQHLLKYIDFRKLEPFLDADVKTIFANAQRQSAAKPNESNASCPECKSVNVVCQNQNSYHCLAAGCALTGRGICCKHNTAFSRPRNAFTGALDLYDTPRCATCVAEANGDINVADVLSRIQDALNDRCPSCNGYVGEPEDFNSCMALKCSHCPQAFCGYCYAYGGNWADTHTHARNCTKNPRTNYFVESEAVWRDLMEGRKLEIVEAILGTANLGVDSTQIVRDRAMTYIVHK